MKKIMTNIIKNVSAVIFAMQLCLMRVYASGLDVENSNRGFFTMETIRLIPYFFAAATTIAVVLIVIIHPKLQGNEPFSTKIKTIGIGAAVMLFLFICFKLGG